MPSVRSQPAQEGLLQVLLVCESQLHLAHARITLTPPVSQKQCSEALLRVKANRSNAGNFLGALNIKNNYLALTLQIEDFGVYLLFLVYCGVRHIALCFEVDVAISTWNL